MFPDFSVLYILFLFLSVDFSSDTQSEAGSFVCGIGYVLQTSPTTYTKDDGTVVRGSPPDCCKCH